MTDQFATMIVPANLVDLARNLAAGLAPSGGSGMFTTGLSADGTAPATHFVSTGYIQEEFLPMITDADLLYGACQAAGASVTLTQCQALVTQCDVSQDDPFTAFARLSLQVLQDASA